MEDSEKKNSSEQTESEVSDLNMAFMMESALKLKSFVLDFQKDFEVKEKDE